MNKWTVDRAASALLDAEDTRTARNPITDDWADLDLRTAYAVQDEALCRRVERGESVVGVKLGLTFFEPSSSEWVFRRRSLRG